LSFIVRWTARSTVNARRESRTVAMIGQIQRCFFRSRPVRETLRLKLLEKADLWESESLLIAAELIDFSQRIRIIDPRKARSYRRRKSHAARSGSLSLAVPSA
jgi:hypothetical protein